MKSLFNLPVTKTQSLDNGLDVIWIYENSYPILIVTIQIPIGKLFDPELKEGCCEMCCNLMLKGTIGMTAESFAEAFENTGTLLFSEIKEEFCLFGMKTLLEHSESMVTLFWQMLTNPAFDPIEFRQIKKEMITALSTEFSEPTALGYKHFYAQHFSSKHPAGRSPHRKTIEALQLSDIQLFYKNHIKPHNAAIVVAGQVPIDTMRNTWEKLFSQWNAEHSQKPQGFSSCVLHTTNAIRLIHKPDINQTTLVIGHNAPTELHPDKLCLSLANYIFGGGNFSSRLLSRIRSETGQTYGISSHLHCLRDYGIFSINTSTQNATLQKVLDSILEEYSLFITNGPSEEEVTKAKSYALGSLAFEFEGLPNVIEKLLWLHFYRRDTSFFETYVRIIQEITAQSMQRALQQSLKNEAFVIIAVGRKNEITETLSRYGSISQYNYRELP